MRALNLTRLATAVATAIALSPALMSPAGAVTVESGEKRGDLYIQEVGRKTTQAQRRNADMKRVAVTTDENTLRVTARLVALSSEKHLRSKVYLTTRNGARHFFFRDPLSGDFTGVSEYDAAWDGYACPGGSLDVSTAEDRLVFTVPLECLTRTDPETLDEEGQPVVTGRITKARVHVTNCDTRTASNGSFWASACDESKRTRLLDLRPPSRRSVEQRAASRTATPAVPAHRPGMTSPSADSARESARLRDGRFGTQQRPEADVAAVMAHLHLDDSLKNRGVSLAKLRHYRGEFTTSRNRGPCGVAGKPKCAG